mmetsp:Transcript_15715/g.36097  ORF Transcript_15715/g.36097 Transcript_15715/m.36097 type:complete len:437 (-) Transcript_15715:61-1371(-)
MVRLERLAQDSLCLGKPPDGPLGHPDQRRGLRPGLRDRLPGEPLDRPVGLGRRRGRLQGVHLRRRRLQAPRERRRRGLSGPLLLLDDPGIPKRTPRHGQRRGGDLVVRPPGRPVGLFPGHRRFLPTGDDLQLREHLHGEPLGGDRADPGGDGAVGPEEQPGRDPPLHPRVRPPVPLSDRGVLQPVGLLLRRPLRLRLRLVGKEGHGTLRGAGVDDDRHGQSRPEEPLAGGDRRRRDLGLCGDAPGEDHGLRRGDPRGGPRRDRLSGLLRDRDVDGRCADARGPVGGRHGRGGLCRGARRVPDAPPGTLEPHGTEVEAGFSERVRILERDRERRRKPGPKELHASANTHTTTTTTTAINTRTDTDTHTYTPNPATPHRKRSSGRLFPSLPLLLLRCKFMFCRQARISRDGRTQTDDPILTKMQDGLLLKNPPSTVFH